MFAFSAWKIIIHVGRNRNIDQFPVVCRIIEVIDAMVGILKSRCGEPMLSHVDDFID
jgi:hypothetical protein